jgi:hypothetical protein
LIAFLARGIVISARSVPPGIERVHWPGGHRLRETYQYAEAIGLTASAAAPA